MTLEALEAPYIQTPSWCLQIVSQNSPLDSYVSVGGMLKNDLSKAEETHWVLSFASLRLQAVGIWMTWTGQTSSQQDPGSSSLVGYPIFVYASGVSSGNVNVAYPPANYISAPKAILRNKNHLERWDLWSPGGYFWIRLPNSSQVLLGIAA